MIEKFYTILTNIGKGKIANFGVDGEKVKFVKLKVGDGNGKYYNPTEDQIDLLNTVWEGKVGNIELDKNNSNWIIIETIIPPEVGDFTIREYGVFDEDNNLLAIAKCAETYKPLISNGSTKELIIKMILSVSNTESISFKVDPNIMLAKKKDVDEVNKKVDDVTSQLKECAKNIDELTVRGYKNTKLEIDFNTCIWNGKYYLKGTALNKPSNYNFSDDTEFSLDVTRLSRGIKQEVTVTFIPEPSLRNKTFIRCCLDGNWSEWKQLATTETAEITLLNGWQKGFGDMSNYITKTGDVVFVNMSLKGGNSANDTVLFNLPNEYKPNSNIVIDGACNWATRAKLFITVRMNGDVVIRGNFNSTDTYILNFNYPTTGGF